MAYDARAIANFLLDYAEEKRLSLTVMALVKVIYYAHGWYLARNGAPLTKQPFEAWERGPVIRIVWEAFKGSAKPIAGRVSQLDPLTNERRTVPHLLSDADARFLREVFDGYGHIHALELSDMTHEPGSPWDRVWNAPNGKVTLGMRIPDEAIRQYFLEQRLPQATH